MRDEPRFPLHTVVLNGHTLSYAEQGTGSPLLLVHGSLCDSRYWKSQLQPLAQSHRVLAPNLRHYWPEQWDGSGSGFSIEQHAADMLALIQTVGREPAHVVGHSRGGRIALEMARQQPQLIRTLTLADPGLSLPGAADQRGNFRHHALALISQGRLDDGLALFIDTVTGPNTWRRMVPWFKDMVRDNAGTLTGQTAEIAPPLPPEQIQALRLPTLLIGGALSPPPYPAVLDTLQQWLPQARRIVIAGSSHGMNLGNPRAFNQALSDFLLEHG